MDVSQVNDLIIEYFKFDILKSEVDDDLKKEIKETFEYAVKKKQHIRGVIHDLENTRLSVIRNNQIKRLGSNYNPYPVRLGELKPKLQMEACENCISLHEQLLKIVRNHYDLKSEKVLK